MAPPNNSRFVCMLLLALGCNCQGFDQDYDSPIFNIHPTPTNVPNHGLPEVRVENETGGDPSMSSLIFGTPDAENQATQPINNALLSSQMVEEQSYRLNIQIADLKKWVKQQLKEVSTKITRIFEDIENLKKTEIARLTLADERKQTKIKDFEEKFTEKLQTFERETNSRFEQGKSENDRLLSALSQVEKKGARAKRELQETMKTDKSMAQADSSKVLGPLEKVFDFASNLKPKGPVGKLVGMVVGTND